MRPLSILATLITALTVGCAAGAAVTTETEPAAPSAGGEQAAQTAPATTSEGEAPPQTATTATAPTEPSPAEPLPESLDAGSISRADLKRVLDEGIGMFLQKVSMEAHRPSGRFEGWMLQALFTKQPTWRAACVLREGDVVLRVNNQSVERPEQFAGVWQSLASAGEIAIDVVRDGRGSRVRYLIVD